MANSNTATNVRAMESHVVLSRTTRRVINGVKYGVGKLNIETQSLDNAFPSTATATQTRTKYGISASEFQSGYSSLFCFINDDENKVEITSMLSRNSSADGSLIQFSVDGKEYSILTDYTQEPYIAKSNEIIPDPYSLLPLIARISESNPEFAEAFTKLRDESLPMNERMDALKIASDAMNIEVAHDICPNIEYHPKQLTASMAKRFEETGEFGAEEIKVSTRALKKRGYDTNLAKQGAYRIEHEWSAEAQKYIPDLSVLDNYVEVEDFNQIFGWVRRQLESSQSPSFNGWKNSSAIANVLLRGKPGSGKTTTAEAIGAIFGLPVWVTPISKYTEEDAFQGSTKMINGVATYDRGSCVAAFEEGGICLLEEINLADPGVTHGALSQALEYPYIIKKSGGSEVVNRHPLCVTIGTMNVGLEGTRPLNDALKSRFMEFNVDELPDESFIDIVCDATGVSREVATDIRGAYVAIQDYLASKKKIDIAANCVTLRQAKNAGYMLSDERMGVDFRKAIKMTMIEPLRSVPGIKPENLDDLEHTIDALQ